MIGGLSSLGSITIESESPLNTRAIVPVLLRGVTSEMLDPLDPRKSRSVKSGRSESSSGTNSHATCERN